MATLRRERCAADFGLPADYFLFVGRFIPEKNLEGLLRAFSSYTEQGGAWSLVMAGDGPLNGVIRDMVRRDRFLRRVVLTGDKDYGGLAPLYAFARCLVLASVSETWGLVVNEAMASSLPVLASTHCGCVDDLVENGSNGLTFDPLDQPALADLMLAYSCIPERERLAMGARSAEIIRTYSLGAWADSVRDLLRAVRHECA
jgi:glycosyltransferase involved in cell wall biosynthesis